MTTNPPTPDDAARKTIEQGVKDGFDLTDERLREYREQSGHLDNHGAYVLEVVARTDAILDAFAAKGISLSGPGQVVVSEQLMRDLIDAAEIAQSEYDGWWPVIYEARDALSAARTAQDHDGEEG